MRTSAIILLRGKFTDRSRIRTFEVELLDDIHELATEPVGDADAHRQNIGTFFSKLEAECGEKR